jgi:hypothetical protein
MRREPEVSRSPVTESCVSRSEKPFPAEAGLLTGLLAAVEGVRRREKIDMSARRLG